MECRRTRRGGRGLPVTWKQEKIVKTRDRHRLFVCVSATAGYSSLERAHHTRALDSSTREKTKKKKKQLELSIRDMIIWLLGDGSPRHTHVSRPRSYSDMIILLGPQPLMYTPFPPLAKSLASASPLSHFISLFPFCSTNTPCHVRSRRHLTDTI